MSLRTGIARLHNITIDDALRMLSWLVPFAPRAISWLRSSWKDPFKRYRVVQAPIEVAGWVPMFSLNIIMANLSPLVRLPGIAIGLSVTVAVLFWIVKGQSGVLRRLRERWIMPIPIMAFVCVRCRHGAICHVGHPSRKCPHCKLRWKDEWVDFWKFPTTVEMRIDDVNPGITW